MRRISFMATWPGRMTVLPLALKSIAAQVDKAVVVLNEYGSVPDGLAAQVPPNVEFVVPLEDLKDTGKFFYGAEADDRVLLCDDDIIYPPDYVARLEERWEAYRSIDAVVGVHGVIYSDFFDGHMDARLVHIFSSALEEDEFVNLLGTGTVMCGGYQLPDFEFMRTAARYVDVRFASHCVSKRYPMICVARHANWMYQIATDSSLFESFTMQLPAKVIAETQQIAGFRQLPGGKPSDLMGSGRPAPADRG